MVNRLLALCFSFLFLSAGFEGAAANSPPTNLQPLHEAYLSKVTPLLPLTPAPRKPPESKREIPADRPNSSMIWIGGYWDWVQELNDFEWVCGVWRRPPPDHVWVAGFWKKVEGSGWVRYKGFWSTLPENQLNYINVAPPDPVEEVRGEAPNQNSFWAPGYWKYLPDSDRFTWLGGSYQAFDRDWILVPAEYVIRPQGFVFIPPYWDFPLDARGAVYDCSGKEAIDPGVVLYRYFWHYPDYGCVYWHWNHFHPHFWDDCGCAPPWWGWHGWWGLSWHHHWQIWWWWGHPGFPHPLWINAAMSGKILPPGGPLLALFKSLRTPWFITSKGIPEPMSWLEALSKKGGLPLLPSGKALEELKQEVEKQLPEVEQKLRPEGKQEAEQLKPPVFQDAIKPDRNAQVPQKPQQRIVLPGKPDDDERGYREPPVWIEEEPPYDRGPSIHVYPPVKWWEDDDDDDGRHRRPPHRRPPHRRPKPPGGRYPGPQGKKPWGGSDDDDDGDRRGRKPWGSEWGRDDDDDDGDRRGSGWGRKPRSPHRGTWQRGGDDDDEGGGRGYTPSRSRGGRKGGDDDDDD